MNNKRFGLGNFRWSFGALCLTLAACQVPVRTDLYKLVTTLPKVALTGVSIAGGSLTLMTGTTSLPLSAVFTPANAADVDSASLVWTSSDVTLATVNSVTGAVTAGTALTSGGVSISVSVKNTAGQTFTSSFLPVTITSSAVAVTGITPVSPATKTLNVGGTFSPTASVQLAGATDQVITWTSSDTSVATVSVVAGVVTVTAVGAGTTDIIATTHDGGFTSHCTVTVDVAVTSIALNEAFMGLGVGELLPLTATPNPSTATVVWTSSDNAVATVDATGRVNGVSIGTATITAANVSNTIQKSCDVTVYDMNSSSIPLVGGAAITGTTMNLSGATMAIDPNDGSVYIAYSDNTGAGRVLKSASGSGAWTPVGGNFGTASVPVTSDRAQNISLAINLGIPYVAYLESGSSNFSQVKKFTAGAWVTLAGTFASAGTASYLSLAFDSSNNPFLGEIDAGNATNKVSVYRLASGSWGQIGTGSLGIGSPTSTYTSVGFDPSGLLGGGGGSSYFVAYDNASPGVDVTNFPSGASVFANIGPSGSYVDMTIQSGTMYVASQSSTGEAFVSIKAPTGPIVTHPMGTTRADYTSVAADPRNGTAYVAYADSTSTHTVKIVEIRAGTSSGLPGTEVVNIGDYQVDTVKLAFYVDSAGHGHLYACYGLIGASGGGVLVKDFPR